MSDVPKMRKICIRLSLSMRTGLDYFLDMPVLAFSETISEVDQVVNESGLQNRHNHSR